MKHNIETLSEYLKAHLHHQISLAELAGMLDVSKPHLIRLFKAEFGIPPLQYWKRVRLEKAKELLETTPHSIKEVRNQVGLSDGSHFTRDFQKAFGVTPSEYRKRISGGVENRLSQPSRRLRKAQLKMIIFANRFLLFYAPLQK